MDHFFLSYRSMVPAITWRFPIDFNLLVKFIFHGCIIADVVFSSRMSPMDCSTVGLLSDNKAFTWIYCIQYTRFQLSTVISIQCVLWSSLCFDWYLVQNNVLLDADYTARLTDFGCSFFEGELPEVSKSPQFGALRWMAPEDIDIKESPSPNITQRDIYSFGNVAFTVCPSGLGLRVTDSAFTYVLWQALSGEQPWAEIQRDEEVILHLAKGHKPRRPSRLPIEDQHWEFIEQCWSATESRPAANNIILSIQRFLSSCPPSKPLRDVLVLLTRSESHISVSDDLHEDLLIPDLTNKIHEVDEEYIHHESSSNVDNPPHPENLVKPSKAQVILMEDPSRDADEVHLFFSFCMTILILLA